MKRWKEFFKMIVTAVICCVMGLFSGNKAKEKLVKARNKGQNVLRGVNFDVSAGKNNEGQNSEKPVVERSKNNIVEFEGYLSDGRRKNVFCRAQGPGDRVERIYEASG